MAKVVVCRTCGLECDGKEAGYHTKNTGHEWWNLILPPIEEEGTHEAIPFEREKSPRDGIGY